MDLSINYKDYFISLCITIVVITIVLKIVSYTVNTCINSSKLSTDKKFETYASVINTVIKFIALVIVVLIALNPFFDVTKLLAGAGVLGVMLAFGAQSLIKDILTGFFFLFEKQLHNGDFVTINNKYTGTVEEVGFRALKIREWGGSVLSISNGNIIEILNGNVDRRRIVENIVISYENNPTYVREKLDILCTEMTELHVSSLLRDENSDFVETFNVRGLQDLAKEHRGYKFTIIAVVKDENYFDVMYKVREHLAEFIFDNKIKMGYERIKLINDTEFNSEQCNK